VHIAAPALDVDVWMELSKKFVGKLRMLLSATPAIQFRLEKGKRGLEELEALFTAYGEIAKNKH
jgi:hypothetical protein